MRVEVAGRLIGDDHRRIVDERAGNGHTLLLAAGQLVRQTAALVLQPDLTGCGRSLPYLFAAIALTAVAVLHLLDLLLGISGGIESVRTAIDASPSGLMQFLQAAFWLPELLTVIGVWSAAGACRSQARRSRPAG